MNRVDFVSQDLPLPAWKGKAGIFIRKVLKFLERKNWDLSILFCGDNFIRSLNAQYRNLDEATDVLSFILGATIDDGKGGERFIAGDIVISLETMEKNALSCWIPADEELRRLLIHGILHLDGMDHATNKTCEPMLILQEKILASLAGERII